MNVNEIKLNAIGHKINIKMVENGYKMFYCFRMKIQKKTFTRKFFTNMSQNSIHKLFSFSNLSKVNVSL